MPSTAPLVTWNTLDGTADPDGTIRSGPVQILVLGAYADVADAILPSSWSSCLPNVSVVPLLGDATHGTITETVVVGPSSVISLVTDLAIQVTDQSSPDQRTVAYQLVQSHSAVLSADDGYLMATSTSGGSSAVVTIEKNLCFVVPPPVAFGRSALRDLLVTWINQGINPVRRGEGGDAMTRPKVMILGGGLAGLAAGWTPPRLRVRRDRRGDPRAGARGRGQGVVQAAHGRGRGDVRRRPRLARVLRLPGTSGASSTTPARARRLG